MLQASLGQKGWQPADMLSLRNMLKLLSPKLELEQLPLLPQVHDGRHESLALVKDTVDGKRYVIRLWPAHIELTPGQRPLWIGNVSEIHKALTLELFTFPETGDDFHAPFALLLEDSRGLTQSLSAEGQELLLLQAGKSDD